MSVWKIISEIARTILIMSATGSVIALLLFIMKPLVKNHLPKTALYYLWIFVLIAFLIPFSTFVSIPISTPMAPVQEILKTNVKSTAERQEELAQGRYNMPYNSLDSLQQIEISFHEIGLLNGEFNNYLLFALITMGGVVFLTEIAQYLIFVLKLRRRRLLVKDSEKALLSQLCNDRKPPRIYKNPLVPTPMLIGIFRPAIYLPDMEYSKVQFRSILLHELTHLRRHDVIVKWIAALAVHVHWFNPLAYLVRREIDHACELACDEAVIKSLDTHGKQSYGDTLIAVAAEKKLPKTVMSTTMGEEKKVLKERLGAIMMHKEFSIGTIVVSCVLMASVLCGTIALGAASHDKVTVPIISIYSTDDTGRALLKEDAGTGIIMLTEKVSVHAAYSGNGNGSSIVIYCAPTPTDEPRLMGSVKHDATSPDSVALAAQWNVAEEYPDGYDGYVWAVVSGSDGLEKTSYYVRVVYNPVN